MRSHASSSTSLDDLARRYVPQRALLVASPPSGAKWVHELKLDGYRAGAIVLDGEVRLISRQGRDLTREFPELAAALRRVRAKNAVIDGEIVVLDEEGRSDFQALQNRARASSRAGLVFMAFDALWIDGVDVSRFTLAERKQKLARIMPRARERVRMIEHLDIDGADVFAAACTLGAEGVVSKRIDAPYRAGKRTDDWQKVKCEARQEFVVGGFTEPTHASRGLGSLLLGVQHADALRFVGKVSRGPGFTDAFRRELRPKLEAIETKQSPFVPRPPGWLGRNAHWVKPELVVEVRFSEWTEAGQVRHPSLVGTRIDKIARDVVRERAAGARRGRAGVPPGAAPAAAPAQKLVFPALGVTRDDVARFYERIADVALPHLAGRPITMVRCEGTIDDDGALRERCSFLKHTEGWNRFVPASVRRVNIVEQKKVGEYVVIESIEDVVALVQRGVVELHQWNSRVDDVEHPDRIVLDLDPGDDVSWRDVLAAARIVREALEADELACWPKSTGGKGLHIVVPLTARAHSWDEVFAWSRTFAERLARDHKGLTTSFSKSDRRGRVLVDYKRNHRTAIAVAPFSLRARPHAPIAVPLAWREVTARLKPDAFTMKNVAARLARLRDDPWAAMTTTKQAL